MPHVVYVYDALLTNYYDCAFVSENIATSWIFDRCQHQIQLRTTRFVSVYGRDLSTKKVSILCCSELYLIMDFNIVNLLIVCQERPHAYKYLSSCLQVIFSVFVEKPLANLDHCEKWLHNGSVMCVVLMFWVGRCGGIMHLCML